SVLVSSHADQGGPQKGKISSGSTAIFFYLQLDKRTIETGPSGEDTCSDTQWGYCGPSPFKMKGRRDEAGLKWRPTVEAESGTRLVNPWFGKGAMVPLSLSWRPQHRLPVPLARPALLEASLQHFSALALTSHPDHPDSSTLSLGQEGGGRWLGQSPFPTKALSRAPSSVSPDVAPTAAHIPHPMPPHALARTHPHPALSWSTDFRHWPLFLYSIQAEQPQQTQLRITK
ncbi:hypothetical protein JOQ06_029788, partial [Pogonophryne albipinna]